jgi:hypothetical protein
MLCLSAGAVYLYLSPRTYIGWTNDDAMYVLAARSLATGQYVFLNLPNHPPNTLFFPGLPVFLLPFVLISSFP